MQMIRVIALSVIFQIASADGGDFCGVDDVHWKSWYLNVDHYNISNHGRKLVANYNGDMHTSFAWDRSQSRTFYLSFADTPPNKTKQMYAYFALNYNTYIYLRADNSSKPDDNWCQGSYATYFHFDLSKVIKVEYNATKPQYQYSQDGKIIGTKQIPADFSGRFNLGFRSFEKGQTMIVNPDAAILKHCEHEYKTLKDQVKTRKADAAQDAETISALRQNTTRDQETIEAQYKTIHRCVQESEEHDVHTIKDGTCLQFQGVVIKERHVKAAIAHKLAGIGAKLEDGSCTSAGFTEETWYKAPNCVSKSIWTK